MKSRPRRLRLSSQLARANRMVGGAASVVCVWTAISPLPIARGRRRSAARHASDLVVTRGALVCFRRGVLWRFRAGARLAEHVDVDEVADHRRRGIAEAAGIAVVAHLLGGVAERQVLGIR